jgi:hypothetical protein
MNTATKAAGFLVALVAVFGLALGAAKLVGPVADSAAADDAGHDAGHDSGDTPSGDPSSTEAAAEDGADLPGGLMVSQNGYTFVLAEQQAEPGRGVGVSFTIEGPDGHPVTDYDLAHEKRLHLIAIRRDFTGFQHLHPEMSGTGVWSARVDLTAGQWRLFADFTPTGADPLTLGTDLAVSGKYRPAKTSVSPEHRTAHVDGYTVTLDGDLTDGAEAELTLSVSRNGEPVTDLQPYLGAYGHLVALRAGDLAYLHVHPDGTPGDKDTPPGPDVVFYAAVPSTGVYHLYLDFRHEGEVRTAAFTATAGQTASSPDEETPDSGSSEDDHNGH